MDVKYSNLLKPMKIGNVTLRNRLIATAGTPHFVQGPEGYPTEQLITHYYNKAKGGAAVVTCKGSQPVLTEDAHINPMNIYNKQNQHYFAQMADAVHFGGAKASMLILPPMELVKGFDASDDVWSEYVYGDGSVRVKGKEAPRDLLERVADAYANEAAIAKMLGFDMCFIHMAYRLMFPGRFLSPYSNKRTDEFGGPVENRARFAIMIAERIKALCGQDFLIEVSCSGQEPNLPGGVTVQDTIELAKAIEGKIDLLQIRGESIDPSQPTNLNPYKLPHLEVTRQITQAMHESGCKTKIVLVGGCNDPDLLEEAIADGSADMIGAARSWLSDPDWGQKIYAGAKEDIVPCLRCNKCHQAKPDDWLSVCSVNPVFGLEHKIERMIPAETTPKKVAIIGGGPAGMEAAIIASKRGHKVTLYEESNVLGGLLNTTDSMRFKWTLKAFKEYLIRQVKKASVDIHMNCKATPEMIQAENYDVVIPAIGSQPIIPRISGVEQDNVIPATKAIAREAEMGKNLVVIGGGEVGVEMGMHFAQQGHTVTLLEMSDMLAAECTPIHYRVLFIEAWEKEENLTCITGAKCTGIEPGIVKYEDKDGVVHEVAADTVILSVGMRSKSDEAFAFHQSAPKVQLIGDCLKVGSVQTAMRTGYSTANLL